MSKIYFEKLNPVLCDFIKSPEPAVSARPDWWTSMEKHILDDNNIFPNRYNSTIRSCPSLNDSFNFGYMVYTPIDVFIDSTNPNEIFWNIPLETKYLEVSDMFSDTFISFIPEKLTEKYIKTENYHQIVGRMNTLWGIKTDPGYSIWITHPVGRVDLPFKIFDSVIDTDKFPSIFPYSFLIKNNFKGIIKAGTPFMQIIPFKREVFSSEIVERNIEDHEKNFLKLNTSFINSYKKIFWTRKKFL